MTLPEDLPPDAPGGPPTSVKLGCLRVLVWAGPLGFIFVAGFAGAQFGILRAGSDWVFLGILLLFVGGLGVVDGVLSPRVPKIDGNPNPKRLALHATLFFIVQAVVVPVILFGLVYAACAFG